MTLATCLSRCAKYLSNDAARAHFFSSTVGELVGMRLDEIQAELRIPAQRELG